MDAFADKIRSKPPGAVLAAERERQGLTRTDVAQRLHMSVAQIEALETGEYARLPRGPFLRGFVRNYAKLLNIPADSLLSLFDEAAPRDPAPRIVVPSQNIRFDPLGDRFGSPYVKAAAVAAVAIVLGFAGMYWWFFIRPTPPVSVARVQAPVTKPSPAPTPPMVAPPPAPMAAEAPSPAPAKTEPPARNDPAKVEAPRAAPAKAEPPKAEPEKAAPISVAVRGTGSVLRFRFKGASWVEVRDGRGKVLATGLNAAGSETEVAGVPPLKVVVGNAAEVQLFHNDRAVALEPHTRESVARLSIE